MFKLSYELYLLFWGINLEIIKPGESQLIDKAVVNKLKELGITRRNPNAKKSKGLLGKLGELVKKAVDCCIE